jgi:hypothetical protein
VIDYADGFRVGRGGLIKARPTEDGGARRKVRSNLHNFAAGFGALDPTQMSHRNATRIAYFRSCARARSIVVGVVQPTHATHMRVS